MQLCDVKQSSEKYCIVLEKLGHEERENLLFLRSFLLVTANIECKLIDQKNQAIRLQFLPQINKILKKLLAYLVGIEMDDI